jgi:hypothetical protein
MKRIQLFEFEDFTWFPNWLRKCLTRMMVVMHNILHTSEEMAELVNRGLAYTDNNTIIDLCSGSGGPMPKVMDILKEKYQVNNPKLIMTDLFPNEEFAKVTNKRNDGEISYLKKSVDAAKVDPNLKGLRTMVSSLHHMNPETARKILKNAMDCKQPICTFEISDNSFPKAVWWIAVPINIITSLFISLLARPVTWQQIVFTFFIPIIPVVFAWDGAVSNARTYTLEDMDLLLEGLHSENYSWEKGVIKGKSKKLYLLGLPKK